MRRVFSLILVLIMILVLVVPVSASSGCGEGYSLATNSSHPLGWDSFYFEWPYELYSFEHPYFSIAAESIDNLDLNTFSIEFYEPNGSLTFDTINAFLQSGEGGIQASSVSGFYNIPWELRVDELTTSTRFDFGFYGDNVVYGNVVQLYSTCYQCKILVPAYTKLTYSFSLSLLIPTSKTQPNGDVYTELEEVTLYSGEQVIDNGSAEAVYYSYLPHVSYIFGDYYTALSSDQAFIVGSSWSGRFNFSGDIDYIVDMTTPVMVGGYDYSDWLSSAWDDNVTTLASPVDFESDFTTWIGKVLGGIWRAELLPNITLGGIFSVCFGILFLFVVLKFFR